MASQQQIDANRQNAQKSTGPKTPEGKAAVSQNARTHGLTAQQVCLSGEDQEEFEASRQAFEDELKPVGPLQTFLVQQIVMAAWRLSRLRTLEAGLFQLRSINDKQDLETDYTNNLSQRVRLAYHFRRDIAGQNTVNMLGRYETRVERSFYRALHELQRFQAPPKEKVAKQSQSAPEPEQPQDFTPPSAPSPSPQRGPRPSPGAGQAYNESDPGVRSGNPGCTVGVPNVKTQLLA